MINNQNDFMVDILYYVRNIIISKENLRLLPVDDSILNHSSTLEKLIDNEVIVGNYMPQYLMHQIFSIKLKIK